MTKKTNILGMAVLGLSLNAPAQAQLFVSTGITGANVQVDVNHTQHWTFTPGSDIDIDGALFTIKRGRNAVLDINFTLIEGEFSGWGTAPILEESALVPASVTQSYIYEEFFWNPVAAYTISLGTTYTGVLWSDSADKASQSYFVKGGSASALLIVDETGATQPDFNLDGQTLPPPPLSVPAPTSIALLGLGLLGLKMQRKRA
ncbi:MAG: PEP-CTERM sorting domain-containing protein [Methyloprofundus sp.]|nr:PEP-CTERM sorting domain-containing protein [Methyloprofundus sp.]